MNSFNPRREEQGRNKGGHNKKESNFLSSIHVTSQSESAKEFQDGSEVRQDDTETPLHAEWSVVFPTAAQLLREWEGCSRVATEWDERSWLRDLHDQWKELGRPELTWQDAIVQRALEARIYYHRFVEAYRE